MRIDDPYVGDLVAIPRPYTVGGSGGEAAPGNERPKGVNQVKVIVNIAAVYAVGAVELIIQANDIFPPVLRVVGLKKRILGLDRVAEGGSHRRHLGIGRSDGSAVGRDALRRKDIGSEKRTAGWQTARSRRQLELLGRAQS